MAKKKVFALAPGKNPIGGKSYAGWGYTGGVTSEAGVW
jgi:hypothetical protein